MEEDALNLYDLLGEEGLPWYVMNCVAGNELDLLQQARTACRRQGFSPWDVQGFVVPLREAQVQSHGPQQLKVQQHVKYPGAVFCKMRLCLETFETLTQLGLCRSWMSGTTFRKRGHSRNAMVPVTLGPAEVQKFQLEQAFAEDYPDKPTPEEEEAERQRRKRILWRRQKQLVEAAGGIWEEAEEPEENSDPDRKKKKKKAAEGSRPRRRTAVAATRQETPSSTTTTAGASVSAVAPLTSVNPRSSAVSSSSSSSAFPPPSAVGSNDMDGQEVVSNVTADGYTSDDRDESGEEVVTIMDDESVDEADAAAAEEQRRVAEMVARDYGGFKVGTQIQVTNPKVNVYGEEGVVRRLKDGRLLITFHTFGSKFEAWLEPSDVRPLTQVEIWKGGAGGAAGGGQPQSPIGQADLEAMYGLGQDPGEGEGGSDPFARGGAGGRGRGRSNSAAAVDRAWQRQDLYQRATGRVERNRRGDRVARGDAQQSQQSTRRQREEQWKAYQNVQRFETQQRLLKERAEAKRKATYNDEIWGLVERSSWTGGEDGSAAFGVSDYTTENPQMLWSVSSRRSLLREQMQQKEEGQRQQENKWRRSGGGGPSSDELPLPFRSGPVKLHTPSARQQRRDRQAATRQVEKALEGKEDWTTFARGDKGGGGGGDRMDSFWQGPLEMMTPQRRGRRQEGRPSSQRQFRRQQQQQQQGQDNRFSSRSSGGNAAAAVTPTPLDNNDTVENRDKGDPKATSTFFDNLVSELNKDALGQTTREDNDAERDKEQENELFSSLVTELTSSSSSSSPPPPPSWQEEQEPVGRFASSGDGGRRDEFGGRRRQDADDFFRDMEAELTASLQDEAASPRPRPSVAEDDFFANLERELSSSSEEQDEQDSLIERLDAFQNELDHDRQQQQREEEEPKDDSGDDFFANLESELSATLNQDWMGGSSERAQEGPSTRKQRDNKEADFFASLEAELSDISSMVGTDEEGDNDDDDDNDFFASLDKIGSGDEEEEEEEQFWASNDDKISSVPTEGDDEFFASLESQLDESLQSAVSSTDVMPEEEEQEMGPEEAAASVDSVVAATTTAVPDAKKTTAETKSSSTTATTLPENLTKLTVPVLKDLLRQRGLKVSGKKAELIERLQQG